MCTRTNETTERRRCDGCFRHLKAAAKTRVTSFGVSPIFSPQIQSFGDSRTTQLPTPPPSFRAVHLSITLFITLLLFGFFFPFSFWKSRTIPHHKFSDTFQTLSVRASCLNSMVPSKSNLLLKSPTLRFEQSTFLKQLLKFSSCSSSLSYVIVRRCCHATFHKRQKYSMGIGGGKNRS